MSEEVNRHKAYNDALQRLLDLTDAHYDRNGRFPTRVRVGAAFGRTILKAGASRGYFGDFAVEIDETLGPDDVAMDA